MKTVDTGISEAFGSILFTFVEKRGVNATVLVSLMLDMTLRLMQAAMIDDTTIKSEVCHYMDSFFQVRSRSRN